jgi:diguanylate cyclase (GGDEF)-like protein
LEADVIGIIEKLGRAGTSILITLLSVVFTQLIRFFVFQLTDGNADDIFRGTSFISSLISPLVLAPVFSWYFVGAFFKIRDLERQMRELATYDSMTNLYNRGACLLALESVIRQAKRAQTDLVVLFMDLDHFKTINDTYGHDVGDMVIKRFANYLKSSLRDSDVIGRIGGEEFLVGLPNLGLDGGQFVAEKLRNGIASEPIVVDATTTLQITVSIGLTIHRHTEEINLRNILKKADIALYNAKNSGRNKVCIH